MNVEPLLSLPGGVLRVIITVLRDSSIGIKERVGLFRLSFTYFCVVLTLSVQLLFIKCLRFRKFFCSGKKKCSRRWVEKLFVYKRARCRKLARILFQPIVFVREAYEFTSNETQFLEYFRNNVSKCRVESRISPEFMHFSSIYSQYSLF